MRSSEMSACFVLFLVGLLCLFFFSQPTQQLDLSVKFVIAALLGSVVAMAYGALCCKHRQGIAQLLKACNCELSVNDYALFVDFLLERFIEGKDKPTIGRKELVRLASVWNKTDFDTIRLDQLRRYFLSTEFLENYLGYIVYSYQSANSRCIFQTSYTKLFAKMAEVFEKSVEESLSSRCRCM